MSRDRVVSSLAALVVSAVTAFAQTSSVRVEVAPSVVAVKRTGITGAGFAVASADGKTVTLHYPNHPDDFGGSAGTGTAVSTDGGKTWTDGIDDWPVARAVDLWQERLRDGSLFALGIRWLPDSKKSGQTQAHDGPPTPWAIAVSKDGREWQAGEAAVSIPEEVGVIARPLPHLIENGKAAWLLPAYAWSRTGHRMLLLQSGDHGRNWSVFSTITTVPAIVQAGVPVATRWLETMVSRTSDGSMLAVMRTGSSPDSALVSARSTDGGLTWSLPEKVLAGPAREPVAGKLPNVLLLENGVLALLTSHTKLGCRLYLSRDGTGREWSSGHMIVQQAGGNTSMVAVGAGKLLVFTPATNRIHCWAVNVRP